MNSNCEAMSGVVTQCVEMYETLGLSVEDIATQLELEVESVKTTLLQRSRVYSQNLKNESEVFTDQDFENAKNAISSCLFAEDESTRFRAAKFVINERKGRHDTLACLKRNGNTSFNILILNQQMARAKEALSKSKNGDHKMIDVESSSEKNAA